MTGIRIGSGEDQNIPTDELQQAAIMEDAHEASSDESDVTDTPVASSFEDDEVGTAQQASSTSAGDPLANSDLGQADTAMEDDQEATIQERRKHTLAEAVYQDNKGDLTATAMPLPTMNHGELVNLLSAAEDLMGSMTTEQAISLQTHLLSMNLTGDEVAERFFESATKLTNKLRSPAGVQIAATTPPYKEPVAGAMLDADEASAYVARLKRAYDTVYLAGIHSGLWLKVTVPTNRELSNLMGQMTTLRNRLGFETRGASLSCDSALRNKLFVEWLLERTTKTNMKDSSPETIVKFLRAPDIPLLAMQLASVIHPSGYPIERACSTKPGVCNHIERTNMRLSKAIHYDADRLTDRQLAHMQTALRSNSLKTEDDMNAYQNEFSRTINREREIGEGIKVVYSMPTFEIYANTAEDWANDIRSASEQVISSMTDAEAMAHMRAQANLAMLTKYSAWVERIILNGRVVESRAAINAALTHLSADEDNVKSFLEGVTEYIADCTVGAAGVNDYVCPKCKGRQTEHEAGLLSTIAAIDPVNAFFTLAQLKIQRILSRNSAL